jgi:hypothetical protein
MAAAFNNYAPASESATHAKAIKANRQTAAVWLFILLNVRHAGVNEAVRVGV